MSKTVAFTFDDGPNTVTTPRVLDILEENGIVASFFLIARNITEESAEVARRALRMGCEINNHTVSHPHLNQLPPEEIRAEFDGCTEQIVRITAIARTLITVICPQENKDTGSGTPEVPKR